MRLKIALPRFGSPSISSFLGALTMAEDQTSRAYMDQMALSVGRVVITCPILEHDLCWVGGLQQHQQPRKPLQSDRPHLQVRCRIHAAYAVVRRRIRTSG